MPPTHLKKYSTLVLYARNFSAYGIKHLYGHTIRTSLRKPSVLGQQRSVNLVHIATAVLLCTGSSTGRIMTAEDEELLQIMQSNIL